MPADRAIQSAGQNTNNYDPEFWEFEYDIFRYLEGIDDEQLLVRHRAILRNMRAIIAPNRHVIPIGTFLSSWYWYRKEHQTRYEAMLRKLAYPLARPVFRNPDKFAPARSRSPNAGDLLFRFGTEWLDRFVATGETRITPARFFARMENDAARQDDELEKSTFTSGRHVRIVTAEGKSLPIKGNLKKSVRGADYYAFCTAADWDADLFNDFGADRCAIIRDVDEFERRFRVAAERQLPRWILGSFPMGYYDPFESGRNEYITNAYSKDFLFAYQQE